MKFSFLFLMLTSLCLGQYQTSDFGLIGNVKSLQSVTKPYFESSTTTASGFLDSEQFDSIYLEFNQKKSLVVRENYLDYRGKLGIFDRTTFEYNYLNQIEKIENLLIQNGEEPQKIAQKKKFYYLNNQLIRVDEFNSGRTTEQFWVANYVYNEKNQVKEKVFWMEDEYFSKEVYEFDFNNHLISSKTYSNNHTLGKIVNYKNNKEGLPIEIRTTHGNNESIERYEYGKIYKSSYQMNDSKGKIILKELYDENAGLKEVKKFNYKSKKIDNYSFIFEFDNENNWIHCEILKNEVPTFSIQRKITYF